MLRRVHGALAIALPVVLACASTSSQGGTAMRPQSNVITRAELQEVGVSNLYQAIERLRPRWLTVRSMRSFSMETEVVVYQDQMYLGNQDQLERMGIDGVWEIRYVDGPTAKASLPGIGDRHVQGAIIIYLAPPR